MVYVKYCVVVLGSVAAGVAMVVIAYCVHRRGPLFVSVFSPVLLLMSTFVGSFFSDEKLHLGSIIGGMLIVCGLYMVLWGKGKEMKMNHLIPSQSHPVPSKVKIIVKSPEDVDESNHGNNINISNVFGNLEDSSQNGSEVVPHSDNKRNKEEVMSRN